MSDVVRLEDVLSVAGYFHTYNAINNEHFINLFGSLTDTEIKKLDNLLLDIYGEFPLCKKYAELDTDVAQRMVENCDILFYDLWQTYKEANLRAGEFDYSAPYLEIRESTETGERTQTDTNTTSDTDKVFPFDETTASDNTLNETSATNTANDNNTITKNETVKRTGDKTAIQFATSQINYSQSHVYLELIFTDIVETVCLPII